MPKYRVAIPYHCTVYVTVNAETQEKAEEEALRECYASLCYQCSEDIEMGEFNDSAADLIEVDEIKDEG